MLPRPHQATREAVPPVTHSLLALRDLSSMCVLPRHRRPVAHCIHSHRQNTCVMYMNCPRSMVLGWTTLMIRKSLAKHTCSVWAPCEWNRLDSEGSINVQSVFKLTYSVKLREKALFRTGTPRGQRRSCTVQRYKFDSTVGDAIVVMKFCTNASGVVTSLCVSFTNLST